MRRITLILFGLLCYLFVNGEPISDTIRISFLGDIMSHTAQIEAAKRVARENNSGDYDFSSYFKYIQKDLDNADFVVANMEFAAGIKPYTGYPSFSAPPELPIEAKRAGIDLFLCANNHIADKGRRGIDSTLTLYERIGASYTGIQNSNKESNNPFITRIQGVKVAFVNFTYSTNGFPVELPYIVNSMDSSRVKESIRVAKAENCDLIIALPHWGEEYKIFESEEQRKWEEMLYRWGADVIIGTHPHVVQPIKKIGATVATSLHTEFEIYVKSLSNFNIESTKEREYYTYYDHITAYSLGNYISNMSIKNGQIGILFTLNLCRNLITGEVSILEPKITYLWCCRGGKFEDNYTVLPIEYLLENRDLFRKESEYLKMEREWNILKEELNIE